MGGQSLTLTCMRCPAYEPGIAILFQSRREKQLNYRQHEEIFPCFSISRSTSCSHRGLFFYLQNDYYRLSTYLPTSFEREYYNDSI